jgi:RNA polymerase sigma factor (sigma-70 family)
MEHEAALNIITDSFDELVSYAEEFLQKQKDETLYGRRCVQDAIHCFRKLKDIPEDESRCLEVLKYLIERECAAHMIMVRLNRLAAHVEKSLGAQIKAKLDAEDIVMSAIRSFISKDIPQEYAKFWGHLFIIINRKTTTAFRHYWAKKRDISVELHPPDDWDVTDFSKEILEAQLNLMRLHQALVHLPPREQDVIRLSLEGISFAEISEAIGISVRHASRLHASARKHLRWLLGEQGDMNNEPLA